MHVIAFSTPRHPRWRWRITDSSGVVIEESDQGFDTISAAVAVGRQRLLTINAPDRHRGAHAMGRFDVSPRGC